MKTKVLLAALASMALAGCTNNEQLLDETKKGQEIRFAVAPQTPQTRAEHDLVASPYSGRLRIWAWVDGTNNAIIEGDLYDASKGTFGSNNTYYYPASGNDVDFIAIPEEVYGDDLYIEEIVRTTNGETNAFFEVKHEQHQDKDHNTDLMVSEVITQNSGTVNLILRHLTTKLKFMFEQSVRQDDVTGVIWSVTLKNISLQGIFNHGSLTINNEWNAENRNNEYKDHFWDIEKDDDPCSWQILNSSHILAEPDIDKPYNNFSTTNPYYVMPQHLFKEKQQLHINYEITTHYINSGQDDVTIPYTKIIDLADIPTVEAWAMNKSITYRIIINPKSEIKQISFLVYEEQWGEQGGSVTITPNDSNKNVAN